MAGRATWLRATAGCAFGILPDDGNATAHALEPGVNLLELVGHEHLGRGGASANHIDEIARGGTKV